MLGWMKHRRRAARSRRRKARLRINARSLAFEPMEPRVLLTVPMDISYAGSGHPFHSHNQNVVANDNGVFVTIGVGPNTARTGFELRRSTNGGETFTTVYTENVQDRRAGPPTVETDENSNVYLVYPEAGRTFFKKFSASNGYASPVVSKSTNVATSGGKFASAYDRTRGLIYHGTQFGYFLAFNQSGNLVKSKRVYISGGSAGPSYPQLFVDTGGVIHYAMTTADTDMPYESIRYLKSTDGGSSWKKMNGTPVSTPTTCDSGGPSTMVNLPDEVSLNTWLGNMHVKNGKVHFMYLAGDAADGSRTITDRQHYMRFDATTGVREIDSWSDWGGRWGGANWHIYAVGGFFASDPDDPTGPLLAMGGQGSNSMNKGGSRLVALVSYDNGSTWQDYSRSSSIGMVWAETGFREITNEGTIVGLTGCATPEWASTQFFRFTAPDTVSPVVSAGADQTVAFPMRSAELDGTATDNNPSALTTTWSKVSGPGSVSFGDAKAVDTVAIFSEPGQYVLRLTGDDGFQQKSDDLRVTVQAGAAAEGFLGESGAVSARVYGPDDWHAVAFQQTYASPVVVMGPPSHNGSDPAVVRVRNMTSTGFQFRMDEWDYLDGSHGAETIGYLVMEAGDHTFTDGTRIQAGSVSADENFTTVDFASAFAATPAVLVQAASYNGSSAVTERLQNVTAGGFAVRLQEEEGNDGGHANETVGWVAIERVVGQSDGLKFQSGVTSQDVTEAEKTISFSQSFTAAPVFLANLQTYAGEDPCALRYSALNANRATVFIEEEKSADSEVSHAAEKVGYLAIERGLIATLQPPTLGNVASADNVTAATATLHGELIETGGEDPRITVFWGDDDHGTNPQAWDYSADLGSQAGGTFSHAVSGLSQDRPYYFTFRAANSAGTDWLDHAKTFRTDRVLQVAGFAATISGVDVRLTQDVDLTTLNLYDGPDSAADLPDVTFVGDNVGPVAGCLVWNASTQTLRFLATGGPLSADRYTLTLASRPDGLVDSLGRPLDGDADGIPGGDYTTTLTVGTAQPVVVSLPDFTRGPGQPVDVPPVEVDDGDDTAGLPLHLSEAAGVTSVTLDIQYDPALLTITGAQPGPDLPDGADVLADTSVSGVVSLQFISPAPLPPGPLELITLVADVPSSATYGAAHVLDVSAVTINGGTIAATADDAVHAAAYVGDTTGNQTYSGLDAQRVARVAVHLDSGFDAFPLIDPVVIADVTRNGALSGLDAQRIAQVSVGLDPPEIPPIPPQPQRLSDPGSESRQTWAPPAPDQLSPAVNGEATRVEEVPGREVSLAIGELQSALDRGVSFQLANCLQKASWKLTPRENFDPPDVRLGRQIGGTTIRMDTDIADPTPWDDEFSPEEAADIDRVFAEPDLSPTVVDILFATL